ncbi:hypothetical protein GNI_135770 [Gregarina niphandrodes]|uniref:Uncharacterized protein n=1 Tax=Gregarina niphandrodes TaxID=110365 RepID=A0A023B0V7_GRENI|nr:hypothetical protein GNI_135770 [Gregarina niphandrodes]EZG46025.1 hypothetical protein GNI_135770 [Gregarina niphandrodes]|eukprot:XP_011132399.1 hypothetical protein GNI_135770 [Gregarina niphandrodes]
MGKARAVCGTIEDVTDELDQLDVDHADVVVAQSFNLSRVLLVHVLKKSIARPTPTRMRIG